MKRSGGRILTTHAGRLSGPPELIEVTRAIQSGRSSDIEGAMPLIRQSMAGVIRQQVEAGIDVVSDGELGKVGFGLAYYSKRLTGLTSRPVRPDEAPTMSARTAERIEFADFYRSWVTSWCGREPDGVQRPDHYIGQEEVKADIELFRAALARPG